jgi:cardiolipin synthase A/B
MSALHASIAAVSFLLGIAGFLLALRAILIARTPQSAIAWAAALIVMPIIGIPLFLVFGESRFSGYRAAWQDPAGSPLRRALESVRAALAAHRETLTGPAAAGQSMAGNLPLPDATGGNHARLLIDGEETFDAIFEALAAAEHSVRIQFFIIHDDRIGRAFADHLAAAASRGVDCLVLYDQVGSKKLPRQWIDHLRSRGVRVEAFVTNRQFGRRFQINFRNHRKLVLVDGRVAFLGGLNVGDEYLGRNPRFGPWRDTHMRLEGPVVTALDLPFLEDWNYATGGIPTPLVEEFPPRRAGQSIVLPVASGPHSEWNSAAAVLPSIMYAARERLWLASPYFVPSSPLLHAICHAALRGVDVRIILPRNPDHLLPWLSSFTCYPKLRAAGVRVWRYQEGFMHQKVVLADSDTAVVGSVNLDYRSLMLNFELAAVVRDEAFARDVETMFAADFDRSLPEDLRRFEDGPLLFRIRCRAAALMSPEQ